MSETDPRMRSLLCLEAAPGDADDGPGREYVAWPSVHSPFLIAAREPVGDRLEWFSTTSRRAIIAQLIRLGFSGSRLKVSGAVPKLAEACEPYLSSSCAGISVLNGLPGGMRRPMIAFLDFNGGVLAFGRCSFGEAELARMDAEVGILGLLNAEPSLRGSVPEIGGVWRTDSSAVMVMTASEVRRSAERMCDAHSAFQKQLRAIGHGTLRVCETLEYSQVATLMANGECVAERELRTADRLLTACERYAKDEVWVGLQHRDFAWWNMGRLPDGRLFVYDWERARTQAAAVLDAYHYHCVHVLLRRTGHVGRLRRASDQAWAMCPSGSAPSKECALLLYLMDLLAVHCESSNPADRSRVLDSIHRVSVAYWGGSPGG